MSSNYTAIDDLIDKHKKKSSPVSHAKESEPITSKEHTQIQEVVEHEPHKEAKPFVQVKPESIELPPDLKNMGLQPVQQTSFPSYKNVRLPISDDKVVQGLHQPITSSMRWLATFAMYLLKSAHLQLKVVHGKVVRVTKF